MAKFKSPKVIMVTGAGGYLGSMLCDQFSKSPDLVNIIAADKRPMPEILRHNKKIIWLTANLYQNVWKIPALINKPEVIIHCAWQDEELYGQADLQKQLNTKSARNLMEFAFSSPFVKKIIHLSSAQCYGALPENKSEQYFKEEDALRGDDYIYCKEKIEVEEFIKNLFDQSDKSKSVYVLRPVYITGPRRLQMANKKELPDILRETLPVVPVTSADWSIQYVHEDDFVDVVGLLTFTKADEGEQFEILNIAPNDLVYGKDLAEIFKKGALSAPPILIRALFSLAWHLSSGKIQTPPRLWRYLSFPVSVDGSRIEKKYGFEYLYTSREAVETTGGRYENTTKSDNLNFEDNKK